MSKPTGYAEFPWSLLRCDDVQSRADLFDLHDGFMRLIRARDGQFEVTAS